MATRSSVARARLPFGRERTPAAGPRRGVLLDRGRRDQVVRVRCGAGGGVSRLRSQLAIVLLIPASRHHWSARTALVGVAYAAAGLLFVFANKLTTAANSVFLQATNPLFVVALAPWLLHE